jgi:hypothetical protein
MITRARAIEAIAQRDHFADKVKACGPGLPFDECLKLAGEDLKEQYFTANRVACMIEQAMVDDGRAYRRRDRKLVWRQKARAAS